jgi:hypothetical protein
MLTTSNNAFSGSLNVIVLMLISINHGWKYRYLQVLNDEVMIVNMMLNM